MKNVFFTRVLSKGNYAIVIYLYKIYRCFFGKSNDFFFMYLRDLVSLWQCFFTTKALKLKTLQLLNVKDAELKIACFRHCG
jgi:hypothetical protein